METSGFRPRTLPVTEAGRGIAGQLSMHKSFVDFDNEMKHPFRQIA